MSLFKANQIWTIFFAGILIGGSGIYLGFIYLDLDAKNMKPAFLVDWQIKNEVEKQVTAALNEKCLQYKIRFRDRNGDGRIDLKNHHEKEGLLEILEDQDFNGSYETVTQLENGNRLWTEIDTNEDNSFDVEIKFRNDIPEIIIIMDGKSGHYAKIKKLHLGKVVAENVDTNSDGVLDTAYDFDASESIIATYSIEENPDKRIEL